MTRKLQIKYNRRACIGADICTNKSPEHFVMQEDGKAHLKGSQKEGDFEVLTMACDDVQAEQIIDAASHCPVSVIQVTDLETNEEIVTSKIREAEEVKELQAVYNDDKEFKLDPKGYFLIRTHKDSKEIEVGFCGKRNTVEVKVVGKTPRDIYQTVLREKIIDWPDHAAYLGKELQKAYTALQLGLEYVQDSELDFSSLK